MSLDSFMRRRFWIVKLSGLALAASFAASAVTTTLGAMAFDVSASRPEAPFGDVGEEDEDGDEAVTSVPRPVRPRSTAADDILARNIFCPTCVDQPRETERQAPAKRDEPVAVESALPYLLVATMEADDPRMSLATLRDPSTGATGVFGLGDTIAPGIVVTGVGTGVVQVERAGRAELLRIGEAPVAAPPKAAASPPKPSLQRAPAPVRSNAVASLPGATDAIDCPSEGLCVVERQFVESLMRNPAALANQAAVRPSADGFTLTSVRRGSLPALLGFQSGDVLTSVNGEALDSIDKAISLVTKLRRASNLSVTVLRGGKLVQKEVRIS